MLTEYKFFTANSSYSIKDTIDFNHSASINNALITENNVYMNGIDSYVSIPNNTALNSISNIIQIELILSRNSSQSCVIYSQGLIRIDLTDTMLTLSITGNTSTNITTFDISSLSFNKYFHLLVEVDLILNSTKLYINNLLKVFVSDTGVINTSISFTNPIIIGNKSTISGLIATDSIIDYFSIDNSTYSNLNRINRFTRVSNYINYKYSQDISLG